MILVLQTAGCWGEGKVQVSGPRTLWVLQANVLRHVVATTILRKKSSCAFAEYPSAPE